MCSSVQFYRLKACASFCEKLSSHPSSLHVSKLSFIWKEIFLGEWDHEAQFTNLGPDPGDRVTEFESYGALHR